MGRKKIKKETSKTDVKTKDLNRHSEATNRWCNLTNFLIDKYKRMTEYEPERAAKELKSIAKILKSKGFLDTYIVKKSINRDTEIISEFTDI